MDSGPVDGGESPKGAMNTFRNVLFWMHLICGVAAGAVVFIMSITGVALTYEKQMQRWADGYRAEPPSAGSARLGRVAHG